MNTGFRRWKNRAVLLLMGSALAVCVVPLVSVLWTLLAKGAHVINWHFLSGAWAPVGEHGGIAHAILGSLYLLAAASAVALPLGLLQGMYLAQRSNPRLASIVRMLLDVMSGIPAIIVGVFLYTIMVQPMRRFSMLAGALALAMIMLPIFARTAEEALRAIPSSVDEAGLALGLPRRRVMLRIILRSALPSVLTGAFLALARVAGEAAPLLFTAFGSNEWPGSPMKPSGSLPQLLYDYARQPFEELVTQAWGAALVLVTMILVIRLLTHGYMRWRWGKQEGSHV